MIPYVLGIFAAAAIGLVAIGVSLLLDLEGEE